MLNVPPWRAISAPISYKVHRPLLMGDYSCLLLHAAIPGSRSVLITYLCDWLRPNSFVTLCDVQCPTREALISGRHGDLRWPETIDFDLSIGTIFFFTGQWHERTSRISMGPIGLRSLMDLTWHLKARAGAWPCNGCDVFSIYFSLTSYKINEAIKQIRLKNPFKIR